MTTIEIPDDAAKRVEAVIGTNDPKAIARVVEGLLGDAAAMEAVWIHNRTKDEIRQSAAECDAAMERIENGEGKPFDQAMKDIRDKLAFEVQQ